jgi:hypothetical protein
VQSPQPRELEGRKCTDGGRLGQDEEDPANQFEGCSPEEQGRRSTEEVHHSGVEVIVGQYLRVIAAPSRLVFIVA